jgi:nucleotide-binding universal stress UspA family protein
MLPPKLILSPVDFSEHSDEALKTAAELATQFKSELLLVHVVPALPKLPSVAAFLHEADYERALTADAEKQLQSLISKFQQAGLRARSEVGVANDVGMEILRIAEHDSADWIVIATHGMTGWHRLAFGSVTEKVVRLASCPVLVLRRETAAGSPAGDSKSAESISAGR